LDAGIGAAVVSSDTGPCARVGVVRTTRADEIGAGGLPRTCEARAVGIRRAAAAILPDGARRLGASLARVSVLEVAGVAGPRAVVGVEGASRGRKAGVGRYGVGACKAFPIRIGSARAAVLADRTRRGAACRASPAILEEPFRAGPGAVVGGGWLAGGRIVGVGGFTVCAWGAGAVCCLLASGSVLSNSAFLNAAW
jgi:hypothetical protein